MSQAEAESIPPTDRDTSTARFGALLGKLRVNRRVMAGIRLVLALIVASLIAIKLRSIGWQETLAALPRTPWFYALFAAGYLVQPCAEVLIYRPLWLVGWSAAPVFFRKRVYNELFLDYAGEAYLYLWAKRAVPHGARPPASAIKDVNVLSGVASNAITLGLVAMFFAMGRLTDALILNALLVALALSVAVIVAVIALRRHILGVARGEALRIGGIHALRLSLILALQAAQWMSALPEVSLGQWFLVLTAQMLITRLPFMPNRDVMMVWIGGLMAAAIAASEAHVTAMFIAAGALMLATHAAVFAAGSWGGRGNARDA